MQPPPSPGTERLRRLIDQAGVRDGDYLLCQVVVRALESLGSAKLAQLADSPSWPNIGYELQRMRETLVDWREARDEYDEDEEEAAEEILDDCIGKIKRACHTQLYSSGPSDSSRLRDPVTAMALQATFRNITLEAFFELAARHVVIEVHSQSADQVIAHKIKSLSRLVHLARLEPARRGSPSEFAVDKSVYEIRQLVVTT
ncbi:hypothetical protein JCM11641_003988 [Rhodosporidiobolus odoratus]